MKTYCEIEEYVFAVESRTEAIKIAEKISTIRKKAIKIFEVFNGAVKKIETIEKRKGE